MERTFTQQAKNKLNEILNEFKKISIYKRLSETNKKCFCVYSAKKIIFRYFLWRSVKEMCTNRLQTVHYGFQYIFGLVYYITLQPPRFAARFHTYTERCCVWCASACVLRWNTIPTENAKKKRE